VAAVVVVVTPQKELVVPEAVETVVKAVRLALMEQPILAAAGAAVQTQQVAGLGSEVTAALVSLSLKSHLRTMPHSHLV
jgi:hypothetical protein